MKKLICVLLTMLGLTCAGGASANQGFEIISQEMAHELMAKPGNYLVVDVREAHEYAAGHLPKAILVPLSNLEKAAAEKLPDKEQELLVYCRTGRRSKIAAKKLVALGYKNIKEFGGITTWKYEIVK